MLGYRGHFATKSRRYSTTMRALRTARRNWKRRRHPIAAHHGGDKAVISLTDFEWAGAAGAPPEMRFSLCRPPSELVNTAASAAKKPL